MRSAYAFGGPEGAAAGRTAGEGIRDEDSKRRGAGFGKSAKTCVSSTYTLVSSKRRLY